MPKDSDNDLPLADIATSWLAKFDKALTDRDSKAATSLFLEDCHWRDILAFGWRLETVSGKAEIAAKLDRTLAATKPSNFHLSAEHAAPRAVTRAGTDAVEVIFDFKTGVGSGSGVVRLREDDDGTWRAWTFRPHCRRSTTIPR